MEILELRLLLVVLGTIYMPIPIHCGGNQCFPVVTPDCHDITDNKENGIPPYTSPTNSKEDKDGLKKVCDFVFPQGNREDPPKYLDYDDYSGNGMGSSWIWQPEHNSYTKRLTYSQVQVGGYPDPRRKGKTNARDSSKKGLDPSWIWQPEHNSFTKLLNLSQLQVGFKRKPNTVKRNRRLIVLSPDFTKRKIVPFSKWKHFPRRNEK